MLMWIVRGVGATIVLFAVLANPLIIGRMVAADQHIENTAIVVTILLAELGIAAVGILALFRPHVVLRRRWEMITTAVACVVALGIGELTLRTFWNEPPHGWYGYPMGLKIPDEQLGFRYQANYRGAFTNPPYHTVPITTNGHGLRDDEHAYEKSTGTIRILGLGDSVTFGSGVSHEKTFLEQLEQRFAPWGIPVEVVNAGVDNYEFDQERDYFLIEGFRYAPDIVLLNLTLNDSPRITGMKRLAMAAQWRTLQTPDAWQAAHGNGLRANIQRRCRLCRAAMFLFEEVLGRDSTRRVAYARAVVTEWETNWDRFSVRLRAFHREVVQRGARLIIVVFPLTEQFHSTEQFSRVPQLHLREFGIAHGVPVIDLMPYLDVPHFRTLYLVGDDVHLNAAGHAVVAEALLGALRSSGIIPFSSR